jgi:hypothetical protein
MLYILAPEYDKHVRIRLFFCNQVFPKSIELALRSRLFESAFFYPVRPLVDRLYKIFFVFDNHNPSERSNCLVSSSEAISKPFGLVDKR